MSEVKTRFAPSPTGHLHIGGLRTAIFNYLFSKSNNGKFVLRIEDTDKERSEKKYTDAILEALKWCKIDYDEIYYQSKREKIYKKYIDELLRKGKAYKCFCSKQRLEQLKKEQMERGENPHYDGHCRNLKAEPENEEFVIRIKLPRENIEFNDYVHGHMHFSYEEFDDFIIQRSDGSVMYNFANVVDDFMIGITHVIRGDDHITNTAKQIVIYRLLEQTPPQYAHIPMILGEDKTRLSKRHGAKSVLEYRKDGYLPQALMNYLVRLGWSHGDKEIFTIEELIKYFNLEHLNKSAAVFNPEKLLWVNEEYIKNSDDESLLLSLKQFLPEKCLKKEDDFLIKAMNTLRARTSTLNQMADTALFYCTAPETFEEKGAKKYFKSNVKDAIIFLRNKLQNTDFSSQDRLKEAFDETIKKFNTKMIKIAQPVRIAITGRSVGPGIYEMLTIIKKDESLKRIDKMINEIPDAVS